MLPVDVGVEWFSEAMYSVRRRKGTAMWLWDREGVVAVSGVLRRALSRGCKSPFSGSVYRPTISGT